MTSVINISRNSRINWSVNSLYLYHVYSRGAACRTSQAAASSCSQVAAVRMHFTGKKLQELVHINPGYESYAPLSCLSDCPSLFRLQFGF